MTNSLVAALIALAVLPPQAQSQDVRQTSVVIDRVVFEPNEQDPERIQIWGTFDNTKRGFLYFQLLPYPRLYPDNAFILSDWKYFKMLAGTGKAVQLQSFDVLPVRAETERPVSPSMYPRGANHGGSPLMREPGITREQVLREILKEQAIPSSIPELR